MLKHRTRTTQRLRPWTVWLALCIALVGAVVPTVSHALAWSQGGSPAYGAICTTAQPGTAAADADGAPADSSGSGGQGSAMSLVHCAFCLHSSDRIAPPPAPSVYLFLPQGQPQDLADLRTSFYATPFYSNAAPRGPPTFS
jgi:hypothetical protein